MLYSQKRYPGKFEGCESYWIAQILSGSTPDEEFGDCCEYGLWQGLIKGQVYTFFFSEDSQGFFDYTYAKKNSEEETRLFKLYRQDESDYCEWMEESNA